MLFTFSYQYFLVHSMYEFYFLISELELELGIILFIETILAIIVIIIIIRLPLLIIDSKEITIASKTTIITIIIIFFALFLPSIFLLSIIQLPI